MIQESKSGLNFNHKGYPLGIITDGDPLDRPDGSCERLINVDYDVETGEVINRNSTTISTILNGLTIPAGYNIMKGGCKLFSFNEPINRQVCLVCVQNADGNVRMFVNTWYNPPNSGFNMWENFIFNLPEGYDQWVDEWIEITEAIPFVNTMTKTGTLTLTVPTIGEPIVTGRGSWYSGWFLYNTDIADVNKAFACIGDNGYSVSGSTVSFVIQNRFERNLDDLGWQTGHNIVLMRYPILYHKSPTNYTLNFTPTTKNWIVKTNTAIEMLIGQEGNLWFGFLNKDTTKYQNNISNRVYTNYNKWYGWWLDYATPPVMPLTSGLGSGTYYLTTDSKLGLSFKVTSSVESGKQIKMLGLTAKLNGYQDYCIAKIFDSAMPNDTKLTIKPVLYHHYSRRITGVNLYGGGSDVKDSTEDPNRFVQNWSEVYNSSNIFNYFPIYTYDQNLIITLGYWDTVLQIPAVDANQLLGNTLSGDLNYLPEEAPYITSTIGVFAQGRLFLNNTEQGDEIRYSLFQREDILPLQNKRAIDSTDKDENTAIDLLGVNPTIFKNNSIHIVGIEGAVEAQWRLLEVKGTVGCPYPNSIVRTPYGLMFVNDSGIYLLTDNGEPVNVIRNRRLQEYLALNKGAIVGNWYANHSEVWYYMGLDEEERALFWICKLNKEEKQIGWKDYKFSFSSGDWAIVDVISDEDANFYLVTNKKLIRYNNDDELCTGLDADGNGYEIDILPNYDIVSSSKDKFHWIEGSVRFEVTNYSGRTQTLTIVVYGENNQLIKVRNYDITNNGNLIFRNGLSNSQRALKVGIAGTLTGQGLFRLQEINTRIKPLTKPIKSGYSKVG